MLTGDPGKSLMEKIPQMCSDWNLDQPTFGKLPVLDMQSWGEV